MISDVKCGKYEGKGLPQEFGKGAVKGNSLQGEKPRELARWDSPKNSGYFHLTAQNLDLM